MHHACIIIGNFFYTFFFRLFQEINTIISTRYLISNNKTNGTSENNMIPFKLFLSHLFLFNLFLSQYFAFTSFPLFCSSQTRKRQSFSSPLVSMKMIESDTGLKTVSPNDAKGVIFDIDGVYH